MGIGRTVNIGDREVTRIGLGTNRLADTPENRGFIAAAVDVGVQLIDTAHLYAGGESEQVIGTALGATTHGAVVATKGGYNAGEGQPGRLREQVEESFRRLRTETITLYYLHRVDPETPLSESLGVLKEYRDAGRIEHVGVSAVSVEQIERAREVVPIAAVQNAYSLADRADDDVVDLCDAERIVFVPYYPLRNVDVGRVERIAERYDATPSQIALAWLLKRSPIVVPIPGTLSIDHLRENLAALEIELEDEDFERLADY
jgi:aryl-alcohol dehydrogenase-like predicted oxidoreductase